MKCIFHSKDFDGFCSAAIVKHRFPDAVLIGYDYNQLIPYELIPANEPILMVDVSLPMNQMEDLNTHSGGCLTWIDHHQGAIDDYRNYLSKKDGRPFLIPVLQTELAACEITWNYLFENKPIPPAVRLLGEYDTWRNHNENRWDNEVLPFQYGLSQICSSVESFPIDLLIGYSVLADELVTQIKSMGKPIVTFMRARNEKACKGAFEATFEGLRAICLNITGADSDTFRSVYKPNHHDLMIPFSFKGNVWFVTLYTTHKEVDCATLAKKYGGNGHAAAAGFRTRAIKEILHIEEI